jgi:lipopolysaccharide biosynthesis glycosyltransferase
MNIVMASSDLYSKLAITTLQSLFLNNKNVDEIIVYYIGDKLSDESYTNLMNLAKEHQRCINFIPMPEHFDQFIGSNRNGQTVFCYCYFQELLPVDKVLLLEADQLITGNIEEIYNTDVSDYYIAAADDLQSSIYKKKIGMKTSSPYVNCGMILYNLKKWREDGMTARMTEILKSNEHMFFYDVQDVINYAVEGKVKLLPPKYNCTTAVFLFDYKDMLRYRRPSTKCTKEEFAEGKNNPLIVHFTKNQIIQPRPWVEDCYHSYKEYYLTVRNQTVMKDVPLWKHNPGKLNKFANFLYMKVSKSLTASLLGIVHAYLYPAFLYKFLFKTK